MATKRKTPRARGLEVLRFIPYNLRCLATAGILLEDAHSLALQLIAKMRAAKKLEVVMTMREAMFTMVYWNGKPCLPPVSPDYISLVGSLAQVHQWCGFFNHCDVAGLTFANPDSHFTQDDEYDYGFEALLDMPIYFRFDSANMDYWFETATNAVAEKVKAGYLTVDAGVVCQ